jgi:hypothetical protein
VPAGLLAPSFQHLEEMTLGYKADHLSTVSLGFDLQHYDTDAKNVPFRG